MCDWPARLLLAIVRAASFGSSTSESNFGETTKFPVASAVLVSGFSSDLLLRLASPKKQNTVFMFDRYDTVDVCCYVRPHPSGLVFRDPAPQDDDSRHLPRPWFGGRK